MNILFRGTLWLLLAGLLAACSSDPLIVDRSWMPRQIVGHIGQVDKGIYGEKRATVMFRNGTEIRSDVVDLQFIGQLAARDKPPYIVFAGRRCYDCESNLSIYVHSPTSGRMTKRTKRYRYPGRLYSHVNGQLIEETRTFFGECLPGHSAATVVWFVRTRRDTPEWRELVVLVESLGSSLNEETLADPAPSIEPTLTLVEQKRCREIPGRQMSSEP